MIYRERAPSPGLSEHVERLWWLEGSAAEIVAEPIPPDGHAEIVVHGGEPFREALPGGGTLRQERALLAGQATRPVFVSPGGFVRVVGARLRPDAAHALFGAPQSELTDRVADLRDLDPRLGRSLRDDVAGRDRGEQMLDGLDAALAAAVSRRRRDDRPAARAVALALRSGGLVRVAALARSMGVTPRHAERLFRERVGIPPKLFLRIVRFQRALAALRDARERSVPRRADPRRRGEGSRARPRPRSWAELAVSLGYYDQSHFIRDFRAFADGSPGAWSGDAESLSGVFSAVRRDESGPRREDVAFFQDGPPARA